VSGDEGIGWVSSASAVDTLDGSEGLFVACPGLILAGRYRLEEALDAGAHGAVWRARQLPLERSVAIKLLHADVPIDSSLRREFHNEAIHAARVHHPSSVSVFDAGETRDGTAWLAMELLSGSSLEAELRSRVALPVRHAAGIGAQIADALAAIHAVGLVHCDVKPANLFLHRGARGQTAKLVDFGISRATGAGEIAQDTAVHGTPRYLSPERIRGNPYDGAADVYALGIVLVEMTTGEPVFRGAASDPTKIFERHLRDKPPRLRDRLTDCPPVLDRLVDRMLAKTPSNRPSAAEVAGALTRLAQQPVAAEAAADLSPDGPSWTPVELSDGEPDNAFGEQEVEMSLSFLLSGGTGPASLGPAVPVDPDGPSGSVTFTLEFEGEVVSTGTFPAAILPPQAVPSGLGLPGPAGFQLLVVPIEPDESAD